jgi:hypothetical protein
MPDRRDQIKPTDDRRKQLFREGIYPDQDLTTGGMENEGSGATGGDLTGGATAGGESQDLTSGNLPRGGRYGGATGGDVYGAGRGSGTPPPGDTATEANPVSDLLESGHDEEHLRHLAASNEQRAMSHNTLEELRGDTQHD